MAAAIQQSMADVTHRFPAPRSTAAQSIPQQRLPAMVKATQIVAVGCFAQKPVSISSDDDDHDPAAAPVPVRFASSSLMDLVPDTPALVVMAPKIPRGRQGSLSPVTAAAAAADDDDEAWALARHAGVSEAELRQQRVMFAAASSPNLPPQPQPRPRAATAAVQVPGRASLGPSVVMPLASICPAAARASEVIALEDTESESSVSDSDGNRTPLLSSPKLGGSGAAAAVGGATVRMTSDHQPSDSDSEWRPSSSSGPGKRRRPVRIEMSDDEGDGDHEDEDAKANAAAIAKLLAEDAQSGFSRRQRKAPNFFSIEQQQPKPAKSAKPAVRVLVSASCLSPSFFFVHCFFVAIHDFVGAL